MSTDHTLSSTVTAGITLTASGTDGTPFTITSTGAVLYASTPSFYGAVTGVILSTVSNAGHVTNGRYGVYLRDGGLITNTGSIYGGSAGVKGDNISSITSLNPITFDFSTYTSTLVNYGYISTGSYGSGVRFKNGGLVSNSSGGTIHGGVYGITVYGLPGTVINAGSVSGQEGIDLQKGGYVSNASTGVLTTNNPSYGVGIELSGGDATVVNAGQIEAATTGIYVQYNDTGVSIRNTGLVEGTTLAGSAGGYTGNATGGIYDSQRTGSLSIYNAGTIASAQGASGDAISFNTLSYYVSPGVYQNRSAVLDLTIAPGAVFVGAVDPAASLDNHIELTSGGSAGVLSGIGSQFNGFDTIAIDQGASWTLSGDAVGLLNGTHIIGVTSRDTIDLTGTLATSDSFNSSTGVLTLFNASDAEIGTLQLDLTTLVAGTSFVVSNDGNGGTDITTNAICYLRGTRIITARGEIPVEDVRAGDLVVTRFGGLQPVRWVGRQSFGRRFVQNNRGKIPVRISAGALGGGLPLRDLFVSPGHSMLLGEVLLLARQLVNGITITQNEFPEILDYFQFELDTHDCLLAEGSWSESFADGPGLRAQFHNATEYLAAHPDYMEPQLTLCAARPESGPAFERALLPLLARAAEGKVPGPLNGWIDDIGSKTLTGWAIDTHHPELPVQLQIWAGAEQLGSVLACTYRQDLEAAGKGYGNCAFTFALPADLPAAARAALRIRRQSDAAEIVMTDDCHARLRQKAMG